MAGISCRDRLLGSWRATWAGLLAALATACGSRTGLDPATVREGVPNTWWELGDSITYGVGTTPVTGFREELYWWTRGHYPEVTFVGTTETGAWPNAVHDGHPGYTVEDLQAEVRGVWGTHLVLLLIGTNNMGLLPHVAYDGPLAAKHYKELLVSLTLGHPRTAVLVSTIPPLPPISASAPNVDDFNARLRNIWDEFDTTRPAGLRLLRADIHAALSPWSPSNFLPENVHPSAAGYARAAAELERAIQQRWGYR